jgi:hypothetical protein
MRRSGELLLALLVPLALVGCAGRVAAPLVAEEGAPPPARVERCLDRAVTMSSFTQSFPWALRSWPANLELVAELQPALIGRAALVWGWEDLMLRSLAGLRARTSQVHAVAPDAVVQGCIFEFVSRDLERVRVPAHVQQAFGLEVQERHYVFADMLPLDGPPFRYPGHHVEAAAPDISRLETRLWFYHLATLYLDAGLEAIHLGNISRIAAHDPQLRWTAELIGRIRTYAAAHARRGWVILDAHTHGLVRDGRLLLDFHSWPLRPREVGEPAAQDVVLEAGFLDSIYGRSLGGVTPGGVYRRHQRFLVEIDNGYAGAAPGGCELPECVWGYDEISWFARQSPARRDELLGYFWRRVPELDPAGRFQVPAIRPLQSLLKRGCDHYYLHDPEELGCGGGQVQTVLQLWGPPPVED